MHQGAANAGLLRKNTSQTFLVIPCSFFLAFLVAAPSSPLAREADPWFGADKALHASASFVLTGGAYAVGIGTFQHRGKAAALGAGVALAAGALKESLDAAYRNFQSGFVVLVRIWVCLGQASEGKKREGMAG